ncbi:AraC family transcriptional regulator [Paenibacillus sp. N3/727]|uniref:AraC family transcriptional regulator n=1 Tax=Paenibacillus sp. N3/727 TaxID=2925845 RepID=UPI001F538E1B|nr:AraC family transcriptional regulator [Paenibacillus sp. N3/727]UNK19429.1 AraC family transcriptional regulator [Paenibacillus sp. N3/727]
MEVKKLLASEGIDPDIQAHYRFITSIRNTAEIHTHDFFELFLILKGSVIHCINGTRQRLEENTLVFIRDRDVHYYEQTEEGDCQFINLSFNKEVVAALFDYLGEGFPKLQILNPDMPPTVILSKTEKEYVRYRLDRLNLIPHTDKAHVKAEVRALLVELFSRYMTVAESPDWSEHPSWLQELCTEMKKKENFIEGISAMLRVSGKSHAYVCRMFKKHLEITPIQYINRLRLSYAENLLLNTDMEIVNICLEVGLENMSYFYDLFKRQFNMTPHTYRVNGERKNSIKKIY